MRISGRWDNIERKVMAAAFHIWEESLFKYDQHMLMIEALESNEEYDRIFLSLTNLSIFFQFVFKFNEISSMHGLDIDNETLTLYLEKMMGKEYKDYLKVTHKMVESIPKDDKNSFNEDSRKGYLSVLDLFILRSNYLMDRIKIFWERAIEDLENTESETVRLWMEVFQSDEGERFLIKKYPMLRNDSKSKILPLRSILEKEYEDLFPILLKVPERIAKDEEDLHRLSKRANSIAYGLGWSVYDKKDNDNVMDPDKALVYEYSSKVIPFKELMNKRDNTSNNRLDRFTKGFGEARLYEPGLWDWNEKKDRFDDVERMDHERRMNISDSKKNEEKWRRYVHSKNIEKTGSQGKVPGKEFFRDKDGKKVGLDIDEEVIDNDFVRLDRGNETDEEDDSYDIEKDHSDEEDDSYDIEKDHSDDEDEWPGKA